MSEWKESTLGEIAGVQTGPFGSQLHRKDYKLVGTPIITVEHLGDNRITRQNLPLVGDDDKERLSKYLIFEGDIVFSRVGSVDRRAYVSYQEDGWMFSGRLLRVRADKKIIDSKFLSYYFGQSNFKEHIRRIAVGATMPSINTKILKGVEISYPPLPEQKAIADVLSSLDDKIDLLHRQNATLEAIAQTLFRQWFVEEAKDDWDESSLYDAINLIGGGTPKTSEERYWDGNIPWLSGADVSGNHKGFVLSSAKRITEVGLNNSSTKLLPLFSTVISARGTVGKYCLLARPMAFSQTSYGITPRFEDSYFFTYLLIDHSVNALLSAAYGSVFDTITTRTFQNFVIHLPPEEEILYFEQKVKPYFLRMKLNKDQIHTLEKLRDTLLPKLMSGEVRVKKFY